MQDVGKGTYLVVGNSGNVSLGHSHQFTHCKSEILKTLREPRTCVVGSPTVDYEPRTLVASLPTVDCEPRMHVAGLPSVECKPEDACRQFTHLDRESRSQLLVHPLQNVSLGCMSLAYPLQNVSPRMRVASSPIVNCESRAQLLVHPLQIVSLGCVSLAYLLQIVSLKRMSLAYPLQNVSLRTHVTGLPTRDYEYRMQLLVLPLQIMSLRRVSLAYPLQNVCPRMRVVGSPTVDRKSKTQLLVHPLQIMSLRHVLLAYPLQIVSPRCMSLAYPLQNVSPRTHVASSPTVDCEFRAQLLVHPLQIVSLRRMSIAYPLQIVSPRRMSLAYPLQNACKNLLFCEIICLTQACITCLGKSVTSFVLPFNFWAYQLYLNFLLFCRSCLGDLVPRETRGRPPCMPHPTGTILLTMITLQLASEWLKFCRAALTTGKRILDLSVVYLQRPVLGGDTQSRWPASPPSLILFLMGLPHDASRLEGRGPLKERCELRTSSQTQMLTFLGTRSCQSWALGGPV